MLLQFDVGVGIVALRWVDREGIYEILAIFPNSCVTACFFDFDCTFIRVFIKTS